MGGGLVLQQLVKLPLRCRRTLLQRLPAPHKHTPTHPHAHTHHSPPEPPHPVCVHGARENERERELTPEIHKKETENERARE